MSYLGSDCKGKVFCGNSFAFSHDGRYLYALNSGAGSVGLFAIGADGSLTHLQDSDAVLPAGVVNGIAAW